MYCIVYNFFGKGHLQTAVAIVFTPSTSPDLTQCQLSKFLKPWRGGLNKFQQETWRTRSKNRQGVEESISSFTLIIQYNYAKCVTTISQNNPERCGVCSHTMQYNIILGTVMGWVRVWTLIKNYFLRDCKIVINIFDIFLCRNWILESRLDHWTTTEHKIREKTTALGLPRQQNVSLWGSRQPTSFSTDL